METIPRGTHSLTYFFVWMMSTQVFGTDKWPKEYMIVVMKWKVCMSSVTVNTYAITILCSC